MDRLRSVESEIDYPAAEEPRMDPPPAIGTDERRMHVRAYNYWVSLLDGRAYPSIEDLDPGSIDDFGSHSVLIDFTAGPENPAIPFLGAALREDGGHGQEIVDLAHVPPGSLVSRLTDHYLQIIANRAPIGFEAEFVNRRGRNTMYRGILMPFSSDDDTIDFIYGVINWKEAADDSIVAGLVAEIELALRDPASASVPVWADGPNAAPAPDLLPEAAFTAPVFGDRPGDAMVVHSAVAPLRTARDPAPTVILPETRFAGPANDVEDAAEGDDLDVVLDADAGLGDRLAAARDGAEVLRAAHGRTRAALYRALGLAYDFALLTRALPADYAELLEDSGIKPQARAPMTPVVKLVFGADYDKTRLTEFAAALSWGLSHSVALGEFRAVLESHEGGLKGVVAAERASRRPAAKPASSETARGILRSIVSRGSIDIGPVAGEFVLLVARREANGAVAVLAPVDDAAMLDRAIRKVAG